MNQVQTSIPNGTPEQQAFAQQLVAAVNANAAAPLCIVYQAATPNSTEYQTSSGAASQIGDYAWKINSKGGLVTVNASISATGSGFIRLVVDGVTHASIPPGGSIHFASVLGSGGHSLSLQFLATSGTVTVNPSGGVSSVAIYELPENVQS